MGSPPIQGVSEAGPWSAWIIMIGSIFELARISSTTCSIIVLTYLSWSIYRSVAFQTSPVNSNRDSDGLFPSWSNM